MHIAVGHKIGFVYRLFVFNGQKCNPGQIFYIDEGDLLWSKSGGHIYSGLDTLYLHEIVSFARSVYSCRIKYHVWKPGLFANILFCQHFTFSIDCIGPLRIGLFDWRERFFVARSKTTETAHQNKLFG